MWRLIWASLCYLGLVILILVPCSNTVGTVLTWQLYGIQFVQVKQVCLSLLFFHSHDFRCTSCHLSPYESACIEVIAASQVSKQRGMYANPGKNLYCRSRIPKIQQTKIAVTKIQLSLLITKHIIQPGRLKVNSLSKFFSKKCQKIRQN